MIYLSLFWEFFKIGLFTFGGAYGAIPLIQQSVLSLGWMDEAMFANILAISESTPGPIMVNSATYVGNTQGGILGAAVATLGVVLPSFIIIILISTLFQKIMKHHAVQGILRGVKPCVMGVILATGIHMVLSALIGSVSVSSIDWKTACILLVLISVMVLFVRLRKKEFSPIGLIVISAILGIILF